jgi:hypothetical protein
LPGFAQSFLTYCQLLKPVADIVRRTVASTDIRQSHRYYDLLIDTHLPPEERENKASFTYDGMADRVSRAVVPDEEMEIINSEFQTFLHLFDKPQLRQLDEELLEMERLVDICRHDYERMLGLFDPGVSLDDPAYKPEFSPAAGDSVLPDMIDFHYIAHDFYFTTKMEENLGILLARLSPHNTVTEEQHLKVQKFLAALNKVLKTRLNFDILLALMRAIKNDPFYAPDVERQRRSFMDAYKIRLNTQFQKDKERILRERHESAITQDIKELFGDMEILEMEGYNEENAAMLAQESPETFVYVKPMRILKTFIFSLFQNQLQEAVKRILVEGYFDNKTAQNNLANIFYQCEHSSERFQAFEDQLNTNSRYSLVAVRRYIEEARHGKDVQSFIIKQVENMNARAREILENETNLFGMLSASLTDILMDYKRATPELVTNIRTLGGGRNRELIVSLQNGVQNISGLLSIMKNFTVIKTLQTTPGEQAAALEDI